MNNISGENKFYLTFAGKRERQTFFVKFQQLSEETLNKHERNVGIAILGWL